jgi:hypothetical protein
MLAMIPVFRLPPGFPPAPGHRLPVMDRRRPLRAHHRCWWGGHSWDYRMSTQRVIIQFRQCLRCGEVEVQVG